LRTTALLALTAFRVLADDAFCARVRAAFVGDDDGATAAAAGGNGATATAAAGTGGRAGVIDTTGVGPASGSGDVKSTMYGRSTDLFF
jgi:hypothetical protein